MYVRHVQQLRQSLLHLYIANICSSLSWITCNMQHANIHDLGFFMSSFCTAPAPDPIHLSLLCMDCRESKPERFRVLDVAPV